MTGQLPIDLPADLLHEVAAAARAAFPGECCGWLTARSDNATAITARPCRNALAGRDGGDAGGGIHPTAPERGAETAYVIDGDDLLAFARAFDGDQPPLCIYHSHPNGRAYFSATDRAAAMSPWGDGPAYPVQHLVIGVDADRITEMALFAWSEADSDFIEVARWAGVAPSR